MDDIRNAKNQQWQITYYLIVVLAALIWIFNIIKDANIKIDSFFICSFKYFILALPIMATWFSLSNQKNIIKYRKLKIIALSENDRKLLKINDNTNQCYFKELFFNDFYFVFIFIYWLSSFLVSIYFFKGINIIFFSLMVILSVIENLTLFFIYFKSNILLNIDYDNE